jgi:cyclopropane fatty-acyl-phospholipid synthase-like methyltransferase
MLVHMEDFDGAYSSTPGFFGTEPEESLVRFADLLHPASTALDVGCGQGRNSLFLARRGIQVDALDPSPVAVASVKDIAGRENLSIRTICGTFDDLGAASRGYDGMMIFGLIPILSRVQISALVAAVETHLGQQGYLWVTAFGTWDPAFQRHATEWEKVGHNSFRAPDDYLRTYLEPGELETLFGGFEVLHSVELLGPEHRHGDGPPERHGKAEAVFQRLDP